MLNERAHACDRTTPIGTARAQARSVGLYDDAILWYRVVAAMKSDGADLPEFEKPPVVEVALSIKFKPLALTSVHVGVLWDRFKSQFPRIEDQPPLDLPTETERERVPAQFSGQLRLMSLPRMRSWFVSSSGTQLIQVQHDLFAHNWRRNETDETYPRFNSVRASFAKELQTLKDFLTEQKLGEPQPVQCEVTYINHIFAGRTWQRHDELHKVFNLWAIPRQEFLPRPDDARFLVRYVIPDEKGQFCGRLHISTQPAFAEVEGAENLILATTLTARGRPLGDGLDGALDFLDVGHVWIVRGFADVTTKEIQDEWRRTR
jgi:uncharacterized protein (TIGR04255 family)